MEDLPQYYPMAGSEAVTRHMLWRPHASMEESAASIRKTLARYETGESLRWAIALGDTDRLIGIIDLLGLDERKESCTFAYMLAEDAWNRGYGTEALKAVFAFAFETLGIHTITADHFAGNPASCALMKKAGMTYLETQTGKYQKNGIPQDAPLYRITREEWMCRQR